VNRLFPKKRRGLGLLSKELFHSFSAPFGRLGLLLFFLNARFVIEAALLDLGEETLFGQFFLEIPDGFFYLIIMNNDFHFIAFLSN
jgi:hypothetical protein